MSFLRECFRDFTARRMRKGAVGRWRVSRPYLMFRNADHKGEYKKFKNNEPLPFAGGGEVPDSAITGFPTPSYELDNYGRVIKVTCSNSDNCLREKGETSGRSGVLTSTHLGKDLRQYLRFLGLTNDDQAGHLIAVSLVHHKGVMKDFANSDPINFIGLNGPVNMWGRWAAAEGHARRELDRGCIVDITIDLNYDVTTPDVSKSGDWRPSNMRYQVYSSNKGAVKGCNSYNGRAFFANP